MLQSPSHNIHVPTMPLQSVLLLSFNFNTFLNISVVISVFSILLFIHIMESMQVISESTAILPICFCLSKYRKFTFHIAVLSKTMKNLSLQIKLQCVCVPLSKELCLKHYVRKNNALLFINVCSLH